MYAVIRTGGKQYKVAPQDVLQIEKIDGAAGDMVTLADVLMVGGDGEPTLGAPLVAGAAVSAELVEHLRGPKIIIFKKKRRQNYRRKKGHRQDLTTVRILEILTGGKAPSKKPEIAEAKAPKKAAEKPAIQWDDDGADENREAQALAADVKKPKAQKAKAAESDSTDTEISSEAPAKKRAPKKPATPE